MKVLFLFLLFVLVLFSTASPVHAFSLKEVPFQGTVCPYLTPEQLQGAYDFTPLYNQGLNGKGVTIAIVDAYNVPGLLQSVNTFNSYYGLPQLVNGSNFFVYTPLGTPTAQNANWTNEVTLDIEVAHSLAPGATIDLVLAPNDGEVLQAVNYTVNNLPVSIISISWGTSELDYNSYSIDYFDQIFQTAYDKGINVFAAAGDSGAYNGLSTLNVNFPSSSPYVISVGGTSLNVVGDAYDGETAWSNSGGGVSQYFARPSFQPNLSPDREVPDVSFNAGTTICAFVNGSWGGYIGTSLAAPSWAALDAILDQKLGGTSQLLPELYNAYNEYGDKVFHSITSGCNGYYCANGGYSLVTGLGSPIASSLVAALSSTTYTLTFTPNVHAVFNINGVNYTSAVSLNFSYGRQVTLTAYNLTGPQERDIFSSFTGLSSAGNSVTFFVNSSMDIGIDYSVQYAVSEYLLGSRTLNWVNNGSTFTASFPEEYNSSGNEGVLLGISVDNGPVIHKASFSSVVYAPMNITGVFAVYNKTTVVFTGAPAGASAVAEFEEYVPLSGETMRTQENIASGDTLYYAGNSITLLPQPYYMNGLRYVAYNFTGTPSQTTSIQFYEETPQSFRFVALNGATIVPSSVVFENPLDTYSNGTMWALPSTQPVVEKVYYNGLYLLNHSVALTGNSLALNASPLKINVRIYMVPIPGAKVNVSIDGKELSNTTGAGGSVSFSYVPESAYYVSISAAGSTYTYKNVTGFNDSFEIYPFAYEIYTVVAAVGLAILVFVVVEHVRKRY